MLYEVWGGQAVVTRENGLALVHSRVEDASARRPYPPCQGLANDAPWDLDTRSLLLYR